MLERERKCVLSIFEEAIESEGFFMFTKVPIKQSVDILKQLGWILPYIFVIGHYSLLYFKFGSVLANR